MPGNFGCDCKINQNPKIKNQKSKIKNQKYKNADFAADRAIISLAAALRVRFARLLHDLQI